MPDNGGWCLRPMGPDGLRPENYSYPLPRPGEATAWVSVFARGDPELSYTRRFGVRIVCGDRAGEPCQVSLVAPPDAEVTKTSPALDALFDYET